MRVSWSAFWGWVAIGLLGLLLLADELMGIAHVWGLNPITDDAEAGLARGDPTLFLLILALGPAFVAWWLVHIRNHRYRK